MSTCPSISLSLFHVPVPQVRSSSHVPACYCPFLPLFTIAIPHAEVHHLSSYVNNTWPLRLRMWRENKIPGLGCFFFFLLLPAHLLGPSRSQRLSSCWEEYWVTSHNSRTVTLLKAGQQSICRNAYANLYVCSCVCMRVRQIKCMNFMIRCVVMVQFYLSQGNGPSSLAVLSG